MEIFMPKENVSCSACPDLRAEVSWRPDNGEGSGYVQLATVHTDSPATIPSDPPETIATGTAADLTPQAGATTVAAPVKVQMRERLDGWHITLDRDQCNRAIRALRRARDAAYGADA